MRVCEQIAPPTQKKRRDPFVAMTACVYFFQNGLFLVKKKTPLDADRSRKRHAPEVVEPRAVDQEKNVMTNVRRKKNRN